MKLAIPALTVALTLAAVDAFRVDVSDVAPPADILGEHQELERTFKVYSEDALEKISVGIAGPVFIAYTESVGAIAPITPEPSTEEPMPTETPTVTPTGTPNAPTPKPTPAATTTKPTRKPPTFVPGVNTTHDGSEDGSSDGSSSGSGSGSSASDTIVFPRGAVALHAASHKEKLVATVTITGNSSALLELVEIVPYKKDETDGLRLTYKNKDAAAEGFVLTQVALVEKHTLRHVVSEVATVVDVGRDVLTQDTKDSIVISSAGSSTVFVTETSSIKAKSVDLDVASSASIQFVVGSLKLDELSVSLAGSGSLSVHADTLKAADIKTNVAGSGSLYVMAKTVTADDLTSSVYGSAIANIIATETGKVDNEKLTVAGSGIVYAGSIVAKKSNVDVWGSGQAYVQVTDKLKTSASYSGQVYYIGKEPAEVKSSGWFFWRSQVKPAETEPSVAHAIIPAPAVYPSHVAVELTEVRHEHEPRVKLVDTFQGLGFAALTTHLAAVAHGPNGFLIFGSVAVGLVAVAMVAQSYQQHRMRRHYTPLV